MSGTGRTEPADGEAALGGSAPHLPRSRTVDALSEFVRQDVALNRRGEQDAHAVSTGPELIDLLPRWFTAPGLDRSARRTTRRGRPGSAARTHSASRTDGAAGTGGAGAIIPAQVHRDRRRGPDPDPGEIDEAEIRAIETATRLLARCGGHHAGGLRRQAVIGQLYELTELLENSYPDEITRRLFGTVAELAALAGTMSREEGLDATGQKYFVLALHAARQAREEDLGAEIMSRMAQQMVDLGYPRDALALIECARQGSTAAAGASVRSMFLLVEAWSYAHLGEVENCHRAIGAAQEAFASSRPEDDALWNSFGTADMIGMAGRAYRILSEHDPDQTMHAEPLIRQALALREPEQVRDRALLLIDLAITYLMKGELDEACRAGEEAMALVGRLRLSAYVLAQVQTLRAHAERHARSPAAQRLATLLGLLLGPVSDPDRDAEADRDYFGETTTASIPGPACAPTTAPISLR